MIVIDVGCQEWVNEESTHKLIGMFNPLLLFGFDPALQIPEGTETVGETLVIRRKAAAWLHGGVVDFYVHGIDGGVERSAQSEETQGVDLCALIELLPQPLVVKFDCEGAEFPLMQEIHNRKLDQKIDLVLVEYHFPYNSHGWYVDPDNRPTLRCEVNEW